jgi:pilus assembly protein CpaE
MDGMMVDGENRELTKKIRVVIVDDEEGIVDLVRVQLDNDPDIEVVGVGHDGREAIRQANKLRPDVILLDINMPVLNGMEAAARIQSAFPSIAVVILTGHETPENVKQAYRHGVKDFLSKPVSQDVLRTSICEAYAKRDQNAPSRGLAKVWGFYGCKATTGCTTLVLNAAVDLTLLGYKVLVLDLDMSVGDCSHYLGQTLPEEGTDFFAMLPRLRSMNAEAVAPHIRTIRLSAKNELEIGLIQPPSRFTALTVEQLHFFNESLDLLVTMYDHILVDFPPAHLFDSHSGPILNFAERIFALANSDESSLRGLRVAMGNLSRLDWSADRVTLLLSGLVLQRDFDPVGWLNRNQGALGSFTEVPLDARGCSEAQKFNQPLVLLEPEGPYAKFVRETVNRALNLPPVAAQRTSIWERVRGLFSRGR